MEELFKDVFDSLPHVQRIWVNANGDYYLHPKHGCEVIERAKGEEPVSVEAEVKSKSKKKK